MQRICICSEPRETEAPQHILRFLTTGFIVKRVLRCTQKLTLNEKDGSLDLTMKVSLRPVTYDGEELGLIPAT